MKAIALVLTFAAFASPAAAQEKPAKPTPSQEIAKIVAVEEQERDLAKAETLYREALAGKELSADGRALATQRLGALLYRLGRREEAVKLISDATPKGAVVTFDDVTSGLVQGGQDVEREKALREKARELVKQVLEQKERVGPNSPLASVFDGRVAEQLLWVGEAAVPEVAGALATALPQFPDETRGLPARKACVAGLAGFLWLVGGEAAASHLQTLVRDGDPEFRAELYRNANQFRVARMAQLATQLARDEVEESLVVLLLTSAGDNRPVWVRLDVDAVVDVLVQKGQLVRTAILPLLSWDTVKLRPEALGKVHVVVRQALQSSDPELGRAAQRFLMSRQSQASPTGVELLLDELPRIRIPNQQVSMTTPPAEWLRGSGDDRRLDPAIAARLWPRLLACARALDRDAPQAINTRSSWLLGYMFSCARELDARIVPDVLTLVNVMPYRPGFNVFDLLRDKITVANAAQVFTVYDRLPDADSRSALLAVLERVSELPTELYEPLTQAAAAWEREQPVKQTAVFMHLLASTGHPDAATRVLERWRTIKPRGDDAWMLVRLGQRTQAETVRASMREMAADKDTSPPQRTRLLLALLSMHDAPALDLVVAPSAKPSDRHPYAKAEPHPSSPGVTPLQYLLYENPDPPHGFSADDVIGVLQRIAARKDAGFFGSPREFSLEAIPDRVLGAMASLNRGGYGDGNGVYMSWPKVAIARLRARNGEGPLATWFDAELARGAADVIDAFDVAEIRRYRSQLERMIEGASSSNAQEASNSAVAAAKALLRADPKAGVERLLASKYAGVRRDTLDHVVKGEASVDEAAVLPLLRDPSSWIRVPAANYMGSIVSKAAVPDLITMLRDPDEEARKAAADALTRIRFYHEQQAHWDRVLKGMDASPASAAEKLLLQGKAGAPKDQRLLAITSLGTLGVPEALPFLIDWTQDADADVAKAAKDAITQIHLHPRK